MRKSIGAIILLILLFSNNIYSQQLPVDTLYNQSYEWSVGQRERLPEWIFASPLQGCAIGISDPCMNPEAARMQALQRAAYVYSLQQGAHLKLLSDLFSHTATATNTADNESNKILTLGVIEQPLRQGSYRIEKEYTSLFGEKFLQVSFLQTDTCDLAYQSFCELMLLFTKENREEEELKFNLMLEAKCNRLGQAFQSEFELKGSPESLRILSSVNGTPICPLQRDCWYEDCYPADDKKEMITMKDAFWSAYMTSFAKALLAYPFSTVNIRSVDDSYGGNYGSSRELHREKITTALTIIPSIKGINQNHLYVDWQITER